MDFNVKNTQVNEVNLDLDIEAQGLNKRVSILLNSYLALFFLVISQFKPQSIISLSNYYNNFVFNGLNMLWIVAQIGSFLIILSMYILRFKVHTFNLIYFFSVIYIGLVSFLNVTPLSRIISMIISPLSVLMLLELAYRYKTINKLMNTIYIYFGGLIVLNYISMLLYPDSFFTDYRGMDVTWIFGNYQQNINWFIIFIAFSCYVMKEHGGYTKYINLFVYLIIILTTVKVWSATTLVALGVVFGLLILYHIYPKICIFLNPFYAYLIGIAATISIAIFEVQKYFASFIETVLHKNINFSGRMTLWGNALRFIEEKPLFGHGIEIADVTFSKIGKTTAHNHYLNLTYNGGIFYLLLTCLLVYIVAVKTKKYRYINSIAYINISLIGYFVYFLAEAKINLDIFILLLVGSYYLTKTLEDKHLKQIKNVET